MKGKGRVGERERERMKERKKEKRQNEREQRERESCTALAGTEIFVLSLIACTVETCVFTLISSYFAYR